MTKDKVISILRRSDDHVSGERISEELGVTRAAVSSAVKALRADGYDIDAATNRGYRLINAPDLMTSGEMLALLPPERMERVTVLKDTDSTNRVLSDMALSGAVSGHVVIADSQSLGRGRKGRSFFSPAGTGIYFSYLFRPGTFDKDSAPAFWTTVTSRTAVAVSNAIETVCGIRPGIKWVNDLYINGRKICGILTQMDMDLESGDVRSVIVGIGINVNAQRKDFPKELRDIAGSIRDAKGDTVPRARIAAEMVKEMDRMMTSDPDNGREYLLRYREDCFVPGKEITVYDYNGERRAYAMGIDDDYALRVRYEDGEEESLKGGEISIRL